MRWVLFLAAAALSAQTPQNVLLVVNGNVPESRTIADYYRSKRPVPPGNVCVISAPAVEEIDWAVYERDIERPVGQCLSRGALVDKILYIVTTMGVPLKVQGRGKRRRRRIRLRRFRAHLTLRQAERPNVTALRLYPQSAVSCGATSRSSTRVSPSTSSPDWPPSTSTK